MTISESLLPEFDAEMENTRKMLSAVPDGKWDWKPHAKSMSLGQLAGHLAEMASWAKETLEKESISFDSAGYKPYVPQSRDELVSKFAETSEQAHNAIAKASDDDMRHVWSLIWNGQKVMEMPRVAVLRSMVINHIIHHRGQLSVFLRLLDQKVPGLYGPSADEMPTAG